MHRPYSRDNRLMMVSWRTAKELCRLQPVVLLRELMVDYIGRHSSIDGKSIHINFANREIARRADVQAQVRT